MVQHFAIHVEMFFCLPLHGELPRIGQIVAADPFDLIESGHWMAHGSWDQGFRGRCGLKPHGKKGLTGIHIHVYSRAHIFSWILYDKITVMRLYNKYI